MATVKFAEGLKEDREVLEFVKRQIAKYDLDNQTFEDGETPLFFFDSTEKDIAARVRRYPNNIYEIEYYTRISEYFKVNEPREFHRLIPAEAPTSTGWRGSGIDIFSIT
ncbi:hypothetical protein B0S90_2850 [Caldicellulosiruptor bescii]|uniref:Uncharacterized protein n=2 Tax=Caldicellulosiruptor bescii TaxID=31899 RepID=B9MP16_CALBD|nr:hypothetical protein [Caldicellulosiruptor bescii]ACM61575.1 hypothetical protein Athe_2507 [Caldicellulosiruptor bescii DSM 6725]PBC88615.1 hypothetical protein B0S87_1641 [Caldicellulosiruptor bescii]PBC91904.1 hypothetical protein B0S89_2352 [Caldicellulosiruptor bescii]PBD02685.1 hypothetical protein B0S85_0222 [Caldicellulosiruptor bescii]PBD07699.1 hypothetical protein B0S90_2850 [Caldicellulosiruptor bescii]